MKPLSGNLGGLAHFWQQAPLFLFQIIRTKFVQHLKNELDEKATIRI